MQERGAKTRTAAVCFPSTPVKHRDGAEMKEQPGLLLSTAEYFVSNRLIDAPGYRSPGAA